MHLVKINNNWCFSSILKDDRVEIMNDCAHREYRFDLNMIWWYLTNCEDAATIFPDMDQCPVCAAYAIDGVMYHKDKKKLFN